MTEASDGSTPPGDGKPQKGNSNPNGGPDNRNNRRRNRHPRNTNRSNRYEGKCEPIKRSVYDVTAGTNSTDLFANTTKAIAEYIATEYDDAGEYRNGLVELNLPTLTKPEDVDVSDTLNFEIWKLDMRDFRDKSKKRVKNNAKAFALILGQCSRAVRDRVEASSEWNDINDESDVIGLLKLICQSIFTGATTRKKGQSLADAELAFYGFRQGDRMTNSEFLATLLISMSDPKRYGQLAADLENEHTRGTDGYPTNVTTAYDMLVNYKSPNTPKFQPQDSGMAFYIEAGSHGGRGRGDRGGRSNAGRGRGGGR
eukprot:CAMPEP_0195281132 /NCGR_PEP_ID=MMETSP0707-20130614/574_1 /TAXON_ID=33640 /ORGANISM="Asterionellopsis glacialis, Strain CCMP134" /LENGTH=311 /DNA_ID=CAMNT_0040339981 /DNA_START=103 /DNA_END=1035 /DNA_ORIENTATION=-